MLKGKNKMIHAEDKEVKTKAVTKPYLFPTHGITVYASSLKEAQQKLSEIINKK